ncbi:MAG TPA: ankyrin repeat domain-containing protein [Alphaproteobacteria bacterium]|nr:ankyrin repeat domain-containing protein [Alphaproteobacteria bacterium]
MIRGSAFSGIIHGLLLALLVFGLPHIMLLIEDAPGVVETRPEPKQIEVATVTPEQAAEIDKAAARPLDEIAKSASGKQQGLVADAVNTETDKQASNKLQSAAGSNAVVQSADNQTDGQNDTPDQNGREAPSEAQRAAEAAQTAMPSQPSEAQPEKAQAGAAAQQEVAADATATPAQPASTQQAAAAAQDAANERAAAERKTPTESAPSGAAALAAGDVPTRAIQPLVAALPRLDETIGEILAAQQRTAQEAAEAAQSSPAMQQTIARMNQAADQGYAHAQFALAEILLTGDGQPRDIEKGLQYLQRASLNGYVPAQLLTAALAVEGSVIERDLAEAQAWLESAAERGSQQAKDVLPSIEQQLNPREAVRARQRRSQLRQVFVLSSPQDKTVQQPREEQLRVATTLGDVEAVYVLLSQGADANKPDGEGRTATIEAAWRGYGKILNALLDQGADARSTDESGKTALIWAAINGHAEVAQRLISAEIPVNAQDREGMTALMRAAWNGHAQVVDLLLKNRANAAVRDRSGKTALDYAAQSGRSEIVSLLQAAQRR